MGCGDDRDQYLDRLTRVGKLKIFALDGRALGIAGSGDEHIGRRAETAQTTRGPFGHEGTINEAPIIPLDSPVARPAAATGNGDRSAVHVHLAVTDFVEPRPGKSVVANGKVLGDRELISIWIGGVCIFGIVESGIPSGTTADNGVDHFEDAVFGRCEVRRERNLARAATVNGATGETQLLRGALRHDVGNTLRVCTALLFAGKIGSVQVKRRTIRAAKRFRGSHDHVRRDGTGESDGRSHEDRLGGRHVGVVVWSRIDIDILRAGRRASRICKGGLVVDRSKLAQGMQSLEESRFYNGGDAG